MEFILIRHGKTEYTETGRYCGASDPPLSERGRAELEASEVKTFLPTCPPDLVFSSPLSRAVETADLLFADFPSLPLLVSQELREIDFGDFEGRTFAGDLEYDPAYQAWLDTNCTALIPGGDFPDRFFEDAAVGFETIVETCETEGVSRAAIVTHGGVLSAILERYASPAKPWYEWKFPTGGYAVLNIRYKDLQTPNSGVITTTGGGVTC